MRDPAEAAYGDVIDQLLCDPLVELVMRADKIDRAQARELLLHVCRSLGPQTLSEAKSIRLAAEYEIGRDYRRGVAILLFNGHGQVFVGQPRDMVPAWQAPHSGINRRETPRAAALRELKEEIGVDEVEVLAETAEWYRYDFPLQVAEQNHPKRRWRGQAQKWFAMRLTGPAETIDLSTEHPRFSDWRWVNLRELPELIVDFKRGVYADVVREFARFAG